MISPKLRKQLKERSGGMCEGKFIRISGSEVVRVDNCGREGVVAAHIDHAGMGGRKSMDFLENLRWECWLHHELMDERISVREYARLGGV